MRRDEDINMVTKTHLPFSLNKGCAAPLTLCCSRIKAALTRMMAVNDLAGITAWCILKIDNDGPTIGELKPRARR